MGNQIDKDEIGRRRGAGRERGRRGGDNRYVMTFASEKAFQETRADLVVVGNQDRGANHRSRECKTDAQRSTVGLQW